MPFLLAALTFLASTAHAFDPIGPDPSQVRPLRPASPPSRPPIPPSPPPVVIPEKAQKILSTLRAQERVLREKAVKELQALQDTYTREAKLDEAVAIRNKIREISYVVPLSQWQRPGDQDIGKVFVLEITGRREGNAVWGSAECYTSDSDPAVAAVHSGSLKPEEKRKLEFEIQEGKSSYPQSTQNGITTQPYGVWPVCYQVRRAN